MFVTNIFPPQLILQSNYTFSKDKSNFSSLESKILSLINFLRTNPKVYFNHYQNIFDSKYILNIINQINQNNKLIPLKTKKEITLAGKDYLTYLIENNIPKSYFEINKGNKAYFNLQQILSKYGQRKGKIFESVIINSISASEIVNKLIKDEKAIKILLNPDMKYISITCGFIPLWKSQCVIIDIIEDFIVYNNTDNNYNKNGIQILNEIYLDENLAKIEEKYQTKTHKVKYEFTRNNRNKNLEYNNKTAKTSEKYKNILPLYLQDLNNKRLNSSKKIKEKNDKSNEIIFDNNNDSFFTRENIEQINDDISNVNINQIKKQNSFFSIDTDISSILM